MTIDTNKERAEFEAWIRTQPGRTDYTLIRWDSQNTYRAGKYVNEIVEVSWRSWQARATKAPT